MQTVCNRQSLCRKGETMLRQFKTRLTTGTLRAAGSRRWCTGLCFLTLAACQPADPPCPENEPATLTLTLTSADTRTTVSQTQEQDNSIVTLDVFVFRNSGDGNADHRTLDTYRRFQGDGLDNLSLTTTTGPKTICIVANAHTGDFNGITTLDEFRKLTALLQHEELGSFTMYGEASATLSLTNKISVTLSRLVAKVSVTGIRTRFDGTPYQGQVLTGARLYLINAHGKKILYNNHAPAAPVILNRNAYSGTDVNACTEAGLIADEITGNIDGSGHSVAHHFYCYENHTEESAETTKLVLEAELNGVTYYYPIPVNQRGYGWTEGSPAGVTRNTAYSLGITVTRPGSTDPNEPVVPGTVELTITAEDWTVLPHFDKEF